MSTLLDTSAGVDIATDAVRRARDAGADDAVVAHSYSELFEITYDNHDVSMVRTTVNDQVTITVYVGQAKGQSSLTGRSPDLVARAVEEAVHAARSGMADDANAVTEGPSTDFNELGDAEPDRDAMIDTVLRHQKLMAADFPSILMRDSTYFFRNAWRSFANSAGRTHQERRSGYGATHVFSAKDGTRTTSFNHTGGVSVTPFGELIEMTTLRRQMEDTIRSFDPKPVPGTFVGDVIFTPDSLGTLLEPVLGALGGMALVRGTSPYQDALGQVIADPRLTVTNRPLSPQFPLVGGFDGDGIPAFDGPVITDGVLENHLIGWYSSRRLGREVTTSVSAIDVAPGDTSFDDLVAGTERGIILGRFSGGAPNTKLDFSGVAKNSFYVEDGEIKFPIHETMIAGNFADLLTSVRAIGDETVVYGSHAYPALAATGVTISSK